MASDAEVGVHGCAGRRIATVNAVHDCTILRRGSAPTYGMWQRLGDAYGKPAVLAGPGADFASVLPTPVMEPAWPRSTLN
jgi:hypothetical protein